MPSKKNAPRRILFWSAAVSCLITMFLLATLPYTTAGETNQLDEALLKIRVLEQKIRRIASLAEYKIPNQALLCGTPTPIYRPEVKEALEREFYSSLDNRDTVIFWMKRAAKYFPHIEARLKARGLPDDLKYVAVAESDLKIEATSYVGAAGIWQIMPATGKHLGLRVDRNVDQRRDFIKSTEAALNFLKYLYETFGDWHLAMAAYNVGPGRIASELKEQKVDSYYDLNLPRETERYVFRIAAIKLIMSQPAAYGLDFPPEELYPPFKFDTVTLDATEKTVSLNQIAAAAGVSYKQIRELNPALEVSLLSRGVYTIYLPPGTSGNFLQAWNQVSDVVSPAPPNASNAPQPLPAQKKIIHVVKRGETLASISRKYKVSISDIGKWNNLKPNAQLNYGKKLVIYVK